MWARLLPCEKHSTSKGVKQSAQVPPLVLPCFLWPNPVLGLHKPSHTAWKILSLLVQVQFWSNSSWLWQICCRCRAVHEGVAKDPFSVATLGLCSNTFQTKIWIKALFSTAPSSERSTLVTRHPWCKSDLQQVMPWISCLPFVLPLAWCFSMLFPPFILSS